MTRKDYEALADSFGFAIGLEQSTTDDRDKRWDKVSAIWSAIHSIENKLKEDNARFDQEKFRQAIDIKARETRETIEDALKTKEQSSWGL